MEKTKNYKKLAQELSECIYNDFEPTQVELIVEISMEGNPDSISVFPKNGDTLHCLKDIVDFCRVKRLNEYCYISEFKGKNVVACRIF